MNDDLKNYYQNILDKGKKYKELISITPKTIDVALLIEEVLDEISYNVKLYLHTISKKRQLTDLEKSWQIFNTPKEYTLKNFHVKRRYPELSEHLKKCILYIKEKEEMRNAQSN